LEVRKVFLVELREECRVESLAGSWAGWSLRRYRRLHRHRHQLRLPLSSVHPYASEEL
jgi:hypothetical protein